ncbi:hypothetical protein D3C71_1258770 [compost metagenome]
MGHTPCTIHFPDSPIQSIVDSAHALVVQVVRYGPGTDRRPPRYPFTLRVRSLFDEIVGAIVFVLNDSPSPIYAEAQSVISVVPVALHHIRTGIAERRNRVLEVIYVGCTGEASGRNWFGVRDPSYHMPLLVVVGFYDIPERIHSVHELVDPVVNVTSNSAIGIGDTNQVVGRVVVVLSREIQACGVDLLLDAPAGTIVGVLGDYSVRVGDREHLASGVVGVTGDKIQT